MPLCTLHLVQVSRKDDKEHVFAARRRFLHKLLTTPSLDKQLLVACVVRRPVIVATQIDHVKINRTAWDLVLIFKQDPSSKSSISLSTLPDVASEYSVSIGIPSRILDKYAARTAELNEQARTTGALDVDEIARAPARSVENYVPKTSQNLEFSSELVDLIEELNELGVGDGLADARGPVQQLNLLSFKQSKEDKERYYKYGQAFADVAKPFGGEPKVLASVVGESAWDEVSLVNYSSITHFAAMAASESYQSINRPFRLPSLNDTTIICTQEVDLPSLRARITPQAYQAHM